MKDQEERRSRAPNAGNPRNEKAADMADAIERTVDGILAIAPLKRHSWPALAAMVGQPFFPLRRSSGRSHRQPLSAVRRSL